MPFEFSKQARTPKKSPFLDLNQLGISLYGRNSKILTSTRFTKSTHTFNKKPLALNEFYEFADKEMIIGINYRNSLRNVYMVSLK